MTEKEETNIDHGCGLKNNMTSGIIYYTDNQLEEQMMSVVQKHILRAKLPISSVSLKPIDFGDNEVIGEKRGYITMIKQILLALENSSADNVFFCEHDVLYPESHFDFIPPKEDIFYYNRNVWRWQVGADIAIRYHRMLPLSTLCCNRELAIKNYEFRIKHINKNKEKLGGREPFLARKWGYEPGTKKRRRGGITNEDFKTWESKIPLIDIRHRGTFSPTKVTLGSFKHEPKEWEEINIESIPGWNLKDVWNYQS